MRNARKAGEHGKLRVAQDVLEVDLAALSLGETWGWHAGAVVMTQVISNLIHAINPAALPYVAAAVVAAVQHRAMPLVYLGFALLIQFGLGR